MNRSKRLFVCSRMLAMSVGALTACRADAGFRFTNFDVPPADNGGVQIFGINNNGTVAGVVFDAQSNQQGFTRTAAGLVTPFALPSNPGNNLVQTQIGGINDSEVVVGFRPTRPGIPGNPLLVFQNGVVTDQIPLPPEFGNTSVRGLNSSGVMAGSVNDLVARKARGYVRDAEGNFTEFDATPTTQGTVVSGINNHGTVIGV